MELYDETWICKSDFVNLLKDIQKGIKESKDDKVLDIKRLSDFIKCDFDLNKSKMMIELKK